MAAALTQLTTGEANDTAVTTAAAVNAAPLVAAVAMERGGGSPPTDAVALTGGGVTWTQLGYVAYSTAALWLFGGEGTADNTIVTATYSGPGSITDALISIAEISDADTTVFDTAATNSGDGTEAAMTVTIPGTPDAEDVTYLTIANRTVNGTIGWEAGWTELSDVVNSGTKQVRQLGTAWDDAADQSGEVTYSSSGGWGIIGILVNGAAGAGTGHTRTPVDPVGITDTVALGQDRVEGPDNVGITDTATTAVDRTETATDPVGITDTATTAVDRTVTETDPVDITDTVQVATGTGHARSATDPVGITDTAAVATGKGIAVADNVGITDTTDLAIGKGVTVADSVGLTDTVTVAADHVLAPRRHRRHC